MKNENCPCKRINCKRHGDCVACKEHHHNHHPIYKTTTCERNKEKELKKILKK